MNKYYLRMKNFRKTGTQAAYFMILRNYCSFSRHANSTVVISLQRAFSRATEQSIYYK